MPKTARPQRNLTAAATFVETPTRATRADTQNQSDPGVAAQTLWDLVEQVDEASTVVDYIADAATNFRLTSDQPATQTILDQAFPPSVISALVAHLMVTGFGMLVGPATPAVAEAAAAARTEGGVNNSEGTYTEKELEALKVLGPDWTVRPVLKSQQNVQTVEASAGPGYPTRTVTLDAERGRTRIWSVLAIWNPSRRSPHIPEPIMKAATTIAHLHALDQIIDVVNASATSGTFFFYDKSESLMVDMGNGDAIHLDEYLGQQMGQIRKNPADPKNLVPIFVGLEAEALVSMRWETGPVDMAGNLDRRRQRLVERFAIVAKIPRDQLMGVGSNAQYWSAQMVFKELGTVYLMPIMQIVRDAAEKLVGSFNFRAVGTGAEVEAGAIRIDSSAFEDGADTGPRLREIGDILAAHAAKIISTTTAQQLLRVEQEVIADETTD